MKRLASVVVVLVFASGGSEAASTWHVKADAAAGGDGSRSRPFATLEQVEGASQPGDTIRILPSTRPLDGGIQLKNNQRLIGLGDPVTRAPANGARPTITNTRSTRYGGDAIRLANTTSCRTFISMAQRARACSASTPRAHRSRQDDSDGDDRSWRRIAGQPRPEPIPEQQRRARRRSDQCEHRDGADQGRRIGQLLGRRRAGHVAVDACRRR